jgi:hypothetical protein
MGKNYFNNLSVTGLSFIRLNVQNLSSFNRSNVILSKKKQMDAGRATGITWLPNRSGAL